MIKRIVTRLGLALTIAASFALSACAPTDQQKLDTNLPSAVPTAYMLFYDKNSDTAADSEHLLMEVAAVMESSKTIKASVNAFRSPDEAADQDTLRAKAVLAFLVEHGVDASRVMVNPLGVADAIGHGDDGSALQRVEIFLSPVTAPAT